VHAAALLAGYSGIVQCDGYAVYEQLADPARHSGTVTLAFCWSHWRREFFDIDKGGPAPIAHEALERIAALYAIESRIRGRSAEQRRAVRQAETKPLVEKLKAWLEAKLIAVSEKSTIAQAIRYGLTRWDGLVRFLDDGRIEMDTNSVERAMRPIALNRKNSLFAGHDVGASYCSSDDVLIMEGDFGEDPEISDAWIAWHRPRGAQIPLAGRKLG
jgi:transposase